MMANADKQLRLISEAIRTPTNVCERLRMVQNGAITAGARTEMLPL
jgi:hypothetical protein